MLIIVFINFVISKVFVVCFFCRGNGVFVQRICKKVIQKGQKVIKQMKELNKQHFNEIQNFQQNYDAEFK